MVAEVIVNVRAALERVLFTERLEFRLLVSAEKRQATLFRTGSGLWFLPRIGNHIHVEALAANKPGHDIKECLLSEHIVRPTLGILNRSKSVSNNVRDL